jgi:hypothetical protein
MFQFLRGVALAGMMTLVFTGSAAHALDYFGFTLGMNQGDALALAKGSGYEFQPSPGVAGSYVQIGNNGPGYLSFCSGKLFSIGRTFDGTFAAFIGLVRERQNRWGEPIWKTEQYYATGVQPLKQFSSLQALWEAIVTVVRQQLTHYRVV